MNMPRPEFIRGILPRELIDDPSIVMLSPKPYQLQHQLPVFRAMSHGINNGERLIILHSEPVLQGRKKLDYFDSLQEYRSWMKQHGHSLRGPLIYPACYTLKGTIIPGALLLAAYG